MKNFWNLTRMSQPSHCPWTFYVLTTGNCSGPIEHFPTRLERNSDGLENKKREKKAIYGDEITRKLKSALDDRLLQTAHQEREEEEREGMTCEQF